MKTQQQRILELLQQRGERGLEVFEIMTPRPDGLGVAQYNSRIKELREQGHNIINTKPGHFMLEENKELKLERLREEYRQAKEKQEYGKMDLIETRARVIKMQSNNFIDVVEQALI